MSAIAGILPFVGASLEPGLIQAVTSAMAQRGPHNISYWTDNGVSLGLCMFHTTPDSLTETQPLTSEDENCTVVIDGRLDDREELRRELQARGMRVRKDSDAELVLQAYQLWQEDCPRHLLGDFAFAVWDKKQEKLFCARDHFGVKPLFYVTQKRYFAFASDEEALLRLPEISSEPNYDKIAFHLMIMSEGPAQNQSWFKDISSLDPASTISVHRHGSAQLVPRIYWALRPMQEHCFTSDRECEEAFNAVFTQAVRSRLRTLGHPALMLSGGMDSASIAGATRQISREGTEVQLHTFSVISDNASECVETQNIQTLTKGSRGLGHFVSLPSFLGPISENDVKAALLTHAHPVGNTIVLPSMMYLAAARCGHRIMLDGFEGDLVTHASDRAPIADFLFSRQWHRAVQEAHLTTMNNTFLQCSSLPSLLLRAGWDAYAPSDVKYIKRRVARLISREVWRDGLINRDFAKRTAALKKLAAHWSQMTRIRERSHQYDHLVVLTTPGIPSAMQAFNRVASSHGIESRHPWSDKRLVEFYFRLPMHYKIRNGWTKYILRKTMAPWTGDEISWHKQKRHLGWKLVQPVLVNNRQQIREILVHLRTNIEEYIEPRALAELVRSLEGCPHENDLLKVRTVVGLTFWLHRTKKLHLDAVKGDSASLLC